MYDYIINKSGNHPCIVIANKADKLAPTKVANAVKDLQNSLNPLKDLTFLPFLQKRKLTAKMFGRKLKNTFFNVNVFFIIYF